MNIRKMSVISLCLILLAGSATAAPLKVNLTILERFVITGFLPKEASFVNWKIYNDLRDALSPTEAELKVLDLKPAADGGTTANWSAVPEKEITFGEIAEKLIVDALKKLDGESKLLPEHITVYEKFILRGE